MMSSVVVVPNVVDGGIMEPDSVALAMSDAVVVVAISGFVVVLVEVVVAMPLGVEVVA